MTNIPGCFNVGESDYQYHGANRLGANSLLSCLFGGLTVGKEVPRYLDTLAKSSRELDSFSFDKALAEEVAFKDDLMNRSGDENVHLLHDELAAWMVNHVTVKRNNPDLGATLDKIKEIRERYQHITLDDRTPFANQTYIFANQFNAMLEVALIITKGALLRNESRGSHFKPEFPNRDDEHWLKTTVASYHKEEPEITYEAVDLRYLDKPAPRDYSTAKKVKPTLKNVPTNIVLPF
jgi:succinate dehydrogenase / fumarate reductase flavoprotein subunit